MKIFISIFLVSILNLTFAEETAETPKTQTSLEVENEKLKKEVELLRENNRLLQENNKLKEQIKNTTAQPKKVVDPNSVEGNMEDWYAFWGLGITFGLHYTEASVRNTINAYTEGKGHSKSNMALDMLGFYWPLSNNKTIVGFIGNSSAYFIPDSYTTDKTVNKANVSHTQLGGSAMHFFGPYVGKGLFVRGDLGYSRFRVELEPANGPKTTPYEDTGLAVLTGFGYGYRINERARTLFYFTYSNIKAGSGRAEQYAFNIGILW